MTDVSVEEFLAQYPEAKKLTETVHRRCLSFANFVAGLKVRQEPIIARVVIDVSANAVLVHWNLPDRT